MSKASERRNALPRMAGSSLSRFGILLISFACAACASMPSATTAPTFQKKYGGFDYCAVEVTKQTRQDTCGPACLVTLLKYWGKGTSEGELLSKYPGTQQKHYYLLELKAIVSREGLKAYSLSMAEEPRCELEEQILMGRPVICAVRVPRNLYWMDRLPIVRPSYRALTWVVGVRKSHFVVVAGLKDSRVLVMDPAFGFAAFSWRRFQGAWAEMEYGCLLVSH